MKGHRLSKEELMTLKVLSDKGQPNTRIAATLGVSEGTVRYHKRKAASDIPSNGCEKPFKAEALSSVIDQLALEQYDVFHQHRLTQEARDETLADDAELKRFLKGNEKLKKDD